MRLRHPSRERLTSWLNAADGDDPEVDAHVSTCHRCATVLEAIAEDVEELPVGEALTRVLTTPAGLGDRLERGVLARLSSRELMGLMAEMFGAGVETSRLLIVDPPPRGRQ